MYNRICLRRGYEFMALAAICLSGTLPFLGKAFHVDDVLYLEEARQILRTPWDPYGAQTLWRGYEETLFDANFNPPFFHFLMACVISIADESELALHVLESFFVVLAAIALYRLSERFVRTPLVTVAAIVLGPAMLPGQNVMLEGPLMAFWLWAVLCQIRACDTGRVRWAIAAGALAALAIFTKYTGLLLLPLLALLCLMRQRMRALVFAIPPALLTAAWCIHNDVVYGRSHILDLNWSAGDAELILRRIPGVFVGVGSLSLMSILVVFALWARRVDLTLVIVAAVIQAAVFGWANYELHDGWNLGHMVHWFGFAINGGIVLFGVLAVILPSSTTDRPRSGNSTVNDSEPVFLAAWAGLVLLYNCSSVPFLAVRHLLPGFPPLVWIVVRACENAPLPEQIRRAGLLATAGSSVILGYCLAIADFTFANGALAIHDSDFMRNATSAPQSYLHKQKLWFLGQWGRIYYAEQAGYERLRPDRGDQLQRGDILLLFDEISRAELTRMGNQECEPVARSVARALMPVRTIAPGVNYYAYQTERYAGLPWCFSISPAEYVEALRINVDMVLPHAPETKSPHTN